MNSGAILSWALQTGLAVSVLIGLVLIVRRPFAKYFGASAAYALWVIPVLRLFMPTIAVPWVKLPWMNTALPDVANVVIPNSASSPQAVITADAMPLTPPFDFWPFIIALWVIGAGVWLAFQISQHRNMVSSLRKTSTPAPASMCSVIGKSMVSLGLKQAPEIRLASDGTGPLVTGILKPVVVLPKNFTDNFTPAQQHYALVHELAHIKRRDLWASFAALLFRAVNWPNPLVHYAAHKFRADQEAACDAAVIQSMGGDKSTTHGYAETLVHAAKTSTMGGAVSPLGLTIHEPIKERLMTLKTYKSRTGFVPKIAAMVTIIAASAIAAPLTMATDHPGETTVDVDAKSKSKKVIKWTERDDDGNEVSKHYEIITKDGKTTAWSIDDSGNKTEVDAVDIKGPNGFEHLETGSGKTKLKILRMGDGNTMTFHGDDDKRLTIKEIIEEGEFAFGEDTEFPGKLSGENREIFIKRLTDGKNAKVFAYSSDEDLEITSDENSFVFGGNNTKSLVNAAENILSNANTDDLSSSARRKLEKAQRALKEAKEALEAE